MHIRSADKLGPGASYFAYIACGVDVQPNAHPNKDGERLLESTHAGNGVMVCVRGRPGRERKQPVHMRMHSIFLKGEKLGRTNTYVPRHRGTSPRGKPTSYLHSRGNEMDDMDGEAYKYIIHLPKLLRRVRILPTVQ